MSNDLTCVASAVAVQATLKRSGNMDSLIKSRVGVGVMINPMILNLRADNSLKDGET